MRGSLTGRSALIDCLSLSLTIGMLSAGSAASLYEGKRLNLIVGFASGGSSDLDGRLVAQYLTKHIEDNPASPEIVGILQTLFP